MADASHTTRRSGPVGMDTSGTLDTKMGLELLELSAERVVGRMPVHGNTQPFGLWHGGASCVLAETLGSFGANLHAGPQRAAVGVDINATHHRSADSGFVTGTATAIKLGHGTAMYEVTLNDDQDRRICTARLTCQLIPTGTGPVPVADTTGPDQHT